MLFSVLTTTVFVLQCLRLGMFELRCDELISALAKRANNISEKIIFKMLKDHQDMSLR